MNTTVKTPENSTLNRIGLEKTSIEQAVREVNFLLSEYQVYYQNLRGVHWNIQGENFFTLHAKFEELYTAAADNIDMIAERVLILGGTPLHSYQAYLDHSDIDAEENVGDAREAVSMVLHNIQQLISRLRKVVETASQADDEGTADMATELIRGLEKNSWMMGAFLK